MARSKESFSRREREKAKKSKAEDKRQRRINRAESNDPDALPSDSLDSSPVVDQGEIISQLAKLNGAFEAGDLDFDDFDQQRANLLNSLTID